ncbi:MAG: TIGR03915 family putative DNA repair protein [Treponema sp.]|nr:TIGR03915 family putative DNA repair protein [Treponema sp.]
MRLGLYQLLAEISGDSACGATGAVVSTGGNGQGELFGDSVPGEKQCPPPDKADIAIVAAAHASDGMNFAVLPPHACRLFELSIDAFEAIVRAWMSELPVTAETIRYGQKILAAANAATADAQRQAAYTAAADRGDADVRAVLEAAYKVWHEIHRLMGLLRFAPDTDGVYIAHCEPDHLTLPALGPHFRERFGQTPWAIIDERRRLGVSCSGASLEFFTIDKNPAFSESQPNSEWENLWRNYHKTINNESRNNPNLQRRLMPQRYWKYLTELT